MSIDPTLPAPILRPGRVGIIAVYIFFVAVIARTLALAATELRGGLAWYLGLELTCLLLFTLLLRRPTLRPVWRHAYFAFQSALIVALLSLPPHLDFIAALYVLLSYQAALVFTGRTRWIWCGLFVALTAGSLMVYLGALQGLGFAMTPMAGCIVFPAYVIANREIETAQAESQRLLSQLEASHRQLQAYAAQVEELTALEERSRLARALHDSVSQTMFSIILTIRSTQILLKRDPASVRPQLEQLQQLTNHALAEMRSLIAQLRPRTD